MSNDALTADQAAADIQENDRRRALAALKEEQRKATAAKDRAKKAQARLDKAVALAVSSRPKAEAWYAHPGPLDRLAVEEALGFNADDLHALMKRFRKMGKAAR